MVCAGLSLQGACAAPEPDEQAVGSAPSAEPVAPAPVSFPRVSGLDVAVQQQLRNAHAAVEVAAENDRVSGDQYGELGMLYQGHGLRIPAEGCYLNAQHLAPDDFRWRYYLGVLYDDMTQPEKALETLEAALALRPDDGPTLVRVGELLLAQNRLDESGERFREALAGDQGVAVAALVGLGRIDLQQRRFQPASEHLEQALSMAPGTSSIHYPLAMAYRALGDTARAETHLLERGAVRPPMRDPLINEVRAVSNIGKLASRDRGADAVRMGRWDEAVVAYSEVVAADPTDAVSRATLATAYWRTGNREEARREFREALRLDPANARAHLNLGIVLAEDGEDDEAVVHLRRAVTTDPGLNLGHINLGAALQRTGRDEEAIQQYGTLLQLDPANGPARLGQAFSLIRLGRHAAARTQLEEALRVLPDEPAFAHTLARLLAASPDASVRDPQRALALVQQVASTLRTPQVLETLAMAMAELGRYDEARQSQRAVLEVAERSGDAALATRLRETLSVYEAGRPSREPFAQDDPVFAPPPFSGVASAEAEGSR